MFIFFSEFEIQTHVSKWRISVIEFFEVKHYFLFIRQKSPHGLAYVLDMYKMSQTINMKNNINGKVSIGLVHIIKKSFPLRDYHTIIIYWFQFM